MKKEIYPCLWFDNNAKEVANYYCSIFSGAKITSENQMVITIVAYGEKFMLLNGGPIYKANQSISFLITCETKDEAIELHNKLSENGEIIMPLDKYDWSKNG